jgi:hypothetical protein
MVDAGPTVGASSLRQLSETVNATNALSFDLAERTIDGAHSAVDRVVADRLRWMGAANVEVVDGGR